MKLGRNLEHDPRSRAYGRRRRITVKRNVIHPLRCPLLDQGDIGSCEGNTAAEFLNCTVAVKNRKAYNMADPAYQYLSRSVYLNELDAIRLYSAATKLDNDDVPGTYPPRDTGTSGVGIAKAMQKFKAIESYDWTFDFESFLAELALQPIMLGFNWYESMFETDLVGYVRTPEVDAEPVGGHAVLAFVLDWSNYRVGCTNHWTNDDGSPWGTRIRQRDGCFWISMEFLKRLLIHEQGESLIPVLK